MATSLRSAEAAAAGLSARWLALWGSITGRLSILFGLCSFAILALVSGSLDLALGRAIYEDEIASLMEQVDAVGSVLQQDPDLASPGGAAIRRQYSSMKNAHYVIRVLDAEGKSVFETPGLSSLLPAHAFPSIHRAMARPAPRARRRVRDGRTFIVATATVEPLVAGYGSRLIQLAYDGTEEGALASRYRIAAIVALVVGSILSVLGGIYISRRSLQPLGEVAQAMRRVTATQLTERLGGRSWPRELDPVVAAYDAMLDHLAASIARLSQFAADLAHELRTPLNNLIGEAEVLLARPRTAEQYREAIESGLEEYARLARLTEELLFLSRAGSGAETLRCEALALAPLLQDVADFYELLAEERQVSIAVEATGQVLASPDLIRRALINLVSNALRHTPAGGAILLRGGQAGEETQISVGDSGSGIAADHLPRVFDRFFTAALDPEGERRSGLGLSIVKSIVELHGGRVSIGSNPGRGTTVTLAFPGRPSAGGGMAPA